MNKKDNPIVRVTKLFKKRTIPFVGKQTLYELYIYVYKTEKQNETNMKNFSVLLEKKVFH